MDMFSVALLITGLAVFCASWVAKFNRKAGAGAAPLPPGPRGVPILGYLPFLGTDLHLTFTRLAGVYGPIYKVWFGNKMCLILNSPAAVREVVRDKDAIFANRDSPIAALVATYNGSDVAFSDYSREWSKLRKLFVQEMLRKDGLDACYSIRREEVRKAVREVYTKAGTPVNIGKTVLDTAINAVLGMAWSGAVLENDQEGPDFRELLAELIELFVIPNVSDLFPAVAWLDLQGVEKRTRNLSARINGVFDRAIELRRNMDSRNASGSGRKDLLQHLLELKDAKDLASPSSSFSMTQLKALLLDIMLGASDTTATIVEWTVSELLAHPQVLKRVYDELDEVIGLNNLVEESHLPELHYLGAALKEAHRLHPALPLLVPRKPSETTTVGGYTVPKGSKVFINVWAIHRDPEIWDSPLEFKPERFLDGSVKLDFSGTSFQYMPFGSGRRMCAGLPLAERFGLFLLASFLHSFHWEAPGGTEIGLEAKFGLVCKKAVPLVAVPTPRHTSPELYA